MLSWTTLTLSSREWDENTNHILAVIGIISCIWADFIDITPLPSTLLEFEIPALSWLSATDTNLLRKPEFFHKLAILYPQHFGYASGFEAYNISHLKVHITWWKLHSYKDKMKICSSIGCNGESPHWCVVRRANLWSSETPLYPNILYVLKNVSLCLSKIKVWMIVGHIKRPENKPSWIQATPEYDFYTVYKTYKPYDI